MTTDSRFTATTRALLLCTLAGVAACGGSSEAAPPAAIPQVDCSRGTTGCPVIAIAGDSPSATATFSGYADPALRADPADPRRLWMLYSYLEGKPATSAGGQPVGVPVVSTKLARSSDGGATWTFDSRPWSSTLVADPEGPGPASYFGSETPNLAVRQSGTETIWYSVRLSYFLEPVTAYAPRFASSWTMRVASASGPTPAALASAPEAVLGTATTNAAYGVHARLTALSPQLAGCGFWNNPAIAYEGNRLYLIAECLEFDGTVLNETRSRMVVFRTDPNGPPASWSWEYAGVIADRALAAELGSARLLSADISRSRDGALLLVVALGGFSTSSAGQGCHALELASIDPPAVRRDAAGKPVVRGIETAAADAGWHTGACTHDPNSSTGMIAVAATTAAGGGLQAELRATGLRP